MAIGLVAGMLTKGSRSSAGGAARRVMRQPTNPASAVMTPQLKRKRAPGPNLSIIIVAAVGPIADPSAQHHSRVEESWTVRSEEHTSELQSLMRNAYAVCCL